MDAAQKEACDKAIDEACGDGGKITLALSKAVDGVISKMEAKRREHREKSRWQRWKEAAQGANHTKVGWWIFFTLILGILIGGASMWCYVKYYM